MAGIIEIIYRDFFFPYKRMILIIFLLILFIIAGVFAYQKYAKPKIDVALTDDIANANRRQKIVNVYYFHTDWCPHCKKADPEWSNFSKKFNETSVNGYVINCINVNCTNDDSTGGLNSNKSLIQKFNVEHYPTIKMLFNEDIIDFESKVNYENLSSFVNTITK